MKLLPNLRARLEKAFGQHADAWRPGETPPASSGDWGPDAESPPREDADREGARRPAPRASVAPPAAAATSGAPGASLHASLLARLRSPDALREAFVVKEILDRPVGLRPPRGRGIRG